MTVGEAVAVYAASTLRADPVRSEVVSRPQTRELVLALVASGMPKRQIARELGIARSRVREICAAARGCPKRRGHKR